MKKTVTLLPLLLMIATELFAQTSEQESAAQQSFFSVGLNTLLLVDNKGIGGVTRPKTTIRQREEETLNHLGILGIWAFFDARFIEVSAGYVMGISHWKEEKNNVITNTGGSFSAVDFSALLKFPIAIPTGYFFPLAGGGYNLVINASQNFAGGKSSPYPDPAVFSTFRVQAGIGMDYHFGGRREVRKWFARGMILANYTFAADYFVKKATGASTAENNFGYSFLIGIGRGL